MVVNFYKNSSPVIQVNKTLSTSKQVTCNLKKDCDILEPVLILQSVSIGDANYFQIPDFSGRYYFIDRIITLNPNVIEIHGKIDVLMSFKSDILASSGVIERNEYQFKKYINDSKYTILSYERIQTKAFPNSFPNNGEFVLVVAGS